MNYSEFIQYGMTNLEVDGMYTFKALSGERELEHHI